MSERPILLVDNYDSFVYNLARYIGELGYARRVFRNDALTIDDIRAIDPLAIVISPGPCTPVQAGISLEVVRELGRDIPMLGVCLGHQAIGQVYGGRVCLADRPVHGSASMLRHNGEDIFTGIPSPMEAGRYHSLIVDGLEETELEITARTFKGEVMALRHPEFPLYGVQFHPESILTPHGHKLLGNFLDIAVAWQAQPSKIMNSPRSR